MTSPASDIDRRMRDLIATTTPVRRLRMASGMLRTARTLALAGSTEADVDPGVYLFRRFYQREFSAPQRDRIIEHLRRFRSMVDG